MPLLDDFLGGLWIPQGVDVTVPANALVEADNVGEYLPTGGVRGRRGQERYMSSQWSGRNILDMWRHYPRTGQPTLLIAGDNGTTVEWQTVSDSTRARSAITTGTGFATGAHWSLVNWPAQLKTFLVNGVDDMQEFNGSTMAATAAGVAPKGPYITVHNSRLWVVEATNPNWSIFASEIDTEATWPSDNQISVNDPLGGTITGLVSRDEVLIIFKSTALYRYQGDVDSEGQLSLYSTQGCTAPKTIANTPYGIVYLGRGGLYLTDGVSADSAELSLPLRPLFNTRTADISFSQAVGIWNPVRQQYYLRLSPEHDYVYVLSRLVLGNGTVIWLWSRWTNHPMNSGLVYQGSSDPNRVLAGTSDGYVNEWLTTTRDFGADFSLHIRTVARLINADSRTSMNPLREPREGRVRTVYALYRARTEDAFTCSLYYNNVQSADVTFTI